MHVEANYVDGYEFQISMGPHRAVFDAKAPVGKDRGPSPKEMMLASILGCSGMDVAGLLKKHKLVPKSFTMAAEASPRAEHPKIFPRIDVSFRFLGDNLDQAKLIEAATLSMTKYCGVSAMINPTSPIFYRVELNGEVIAEAQANF